MMVAKLPVRWLMCVCQLRNSFETCDILKCSTPSGPGCCCSYWSYCSDKWKELSVAGLRMLEKGWVQEPLISTPYIYDNWHKRVSIFWMLLLKLMDLYKDWSWFCIDTNVLESWEFEARVDVLSFWNVVIVVGYHHYYSLLLCELRDIREMRLSAI